MKKKFPKKEKIRKYSKLRIKNNPFTALTNFNKLGLYLFLFSLILILIKTRPPIFSFLLRMQLPALNKNNEVDFGTYVSTPIPTQPYNWKERVNNDYRVAYQTPPMLLATEYELPEKYLYFIRHEETQESVYGKGVALGITSDSVNEEAKYIIESIKNESGILPEISDIEIRGFSAKRLDYKSSENNEARTIIIVNNKKYTFSFSTIQDQADKLIGSIKFY